MRKLFLMGWFCALVFVAWCALNGQSALALAQDPEDLTVLGGVIVVFPWLVGPGMVAMLRRMKSGGVNLPHSAYWFEGERRAASLDRLAPYADAMGLMLTAFLVAMLGLDLWHGHQGQRTPQAAHLAATGVFLLLTVLWALALVRAFPKPQP